MNDPERGETPEVEAHLAQAQANQKKVGKILLIAIGAIAATFVAFWLVGRLGLGSSARTPAGTPAAAPATTVPNSPITR